MPRPPSDLMLGASKVYEPAGLVEAHTCRAISLATAQEPETRMVRGLYQNPQSASNRSISDVTFGPDRLPWHWPALTVREGLVEL